MPPDPVVDRKLSEAINLRKPCDFSVGGEANDPRGSAQWGPERRIEGALLRTLMLGNHPAYGLVDQPLEIIGARIDGPVDFRAASLTRPVYFTRCAFTDPVDCTDARLKTVSFEGCRIGELRARYAQFDGSLLLRHSHFSGPLDLESASIARDFDMRGSKLDELSPINANRLSVGGSIYFRDDFASEAPVYLEGAQIKAALDAARGSFKSSRGPALLLNAAKIDSFCVLSSASFEAKTDMAISAEAVQVGGFLSLARANIAGPVHLRGARIGSNLNLAGISLAHPAGIALNLERAKITGDLLLNPHEIAKPANGVAARQPAKISGSLLLLNASIEGAVNMHAATIENGSPDGPLIAAEGIQIGKFLNMVVATIRGFVMLRDAQIGRSANLSGATIENPGEVALDLERAKIGGDVFIRPHERTKPVASKQPADITGGILMIGATIGGSVLIHDDALNNFQGEPLFFNRINVAGVFRFSNIICGNGRMSLANARVASLSDEATEWPARGLLLLNGFDYGSLSGKAPTDSRTRLDWLRRYRPDEFNPQPYTTLAAVLRRAGHDRDARRILIARHKDARSYMWRCAPPWLGNVLMGATCGHGYRPWYAAAWFMLFLGIGYGMFNLGSAEIVPLKEPAAQLRREGKPLPLDYPPFRPLLYSADVLLPIVNLQQKDYWAPNSATPRGAWARNYFPVHILAGWFFTTLFVAGVTGLIRRE